MDPEAVQNAPAGAGRSAPPAGARGVSRRELLRRGAAAGGAFAGLWALPELVREAYGEPVRTPREARSVEAGLETFASKWVLGGPVVALTRFRPFVIDKVFNCRVAGTGRSYVLRVNLSGATVTPGVDPYRHADVVLREDDWLGVLYGDFTGFAPLLASAHFPMRDEANKAVVLGIIMYVVAFIPPGERIDPDLLLRVLNGLARRGLPGCEGEPEALEELDRLERDTGGELNERLAPGAHAPPVTRTLSEWVAGLSYRDIPDGAIASAKEQLVSLVACMYAGSRMPPGRRFTKAVRGFRDRPEATVIGRQRFRTSARHAALLNSVYAQILEWEDWTFLAHSGAAVVPTALATGELARASGRELLTAIVAGNEILARSGQVLTDVIHTGNAVPTHQIETPLIAGKLLGLDAGRLQDAVGICCTQPQVTSVPAWTADAKGLLTGWPVMTGVEAAQYAKAGISGRRDILENPGGYCYRVSEIPSPRRLELLIDRLGDFWHFDRAHNELFTKRFPTDGFQLTAVQAILDIANEQAREALEEIGRERLPDAVKRIEMRIPLVMAGSATMYERGTKEIYERIRREPDWTYIALLFDGKYPIAAALANRRLTFHEYTEKTIFDPVVQRLVDRVDLVPDLTMGVFGAEARLELADGRVFTSRQDCIEEFPVSEKLEIAAYKLLSRRQVKRILAAIDRAERFDDVRDLVRILAGRR